MPYTLAEYKSSAENSIAEQVIDEFRRSNWLLENITFDDGANVTGSDTWVYQYDRVTTLATAAVRAVNTEYSPQEAKTTPQTVECKIFGGAFQVDRTQINTARYGSRIAFQMQQKIQAVRALFNDLVINGDDGSSALEFDGIDAGVTGSSTEKTVSIDLSTSAQIDANYKAFLDALYDFLSLLDGTPNGLLMNRTMFSRLRSIAQRAGYYSRTEDAFGRFVPMFDGIPFVDLGDKPGSSNPIIPIVEDASGLDTTSIYAVRLGLDGVHGVSPNGSAMINTYLPDLTQPGALKKGEVEMVASLALKASRSAGKMTGIGVNP